MEGDDTWVYARCWLYASFDSENDSLSSDYPWSYLFIFRPHPRSSFLFRSLLLPPPFLLSTASSAGDEPLLVLRFSSFLIHFLSPPSSSPLLLPTSYFSLLPIALILPLLFLVSSLNVICHWQVRSLCRRSTCLPLELPLFESVLWQRNQWKAEVGKSPTNFNQKPPFSSENCVCCVVRLLFKLGLICVHMRTHARTDWKETMRACCHYNGDILPSAKVFAHLTKKFICSSAIAIVIKF